ncbi:hypothetical protein VIGAN_03000100, partial [Vigna angularis var. angularis]
KRSINHESSEFKSSIDKAVVSFHNRGNWKLAAINSTALNIPFALPFTRHTPPHSNSCSSFSSSFPFFLRIHYALITTPFTNGAACLVCLFPFRNFIRVSSRRAVSLQQWSLSAQQPHRSTPP